VTYEKVAGILIASPFCWLIGVWIWRVLRNAVSFVRNRPSPSTTRLSSAEKWVVLCSLASTFSFALVLPLWEAQMRYLEDAIGGAVVAAAAASFWLVRRADDGPLVLRRAARAGILALGAYTIFVGVFSGFSTFEENFEHSNPYLYRSLRKTLSVCTGAHE
jgi:hypothetical protein